MTLAHLPTKKAQHITSCNPLLMHICYNFDIIQIKDLNIGLFNRSFLYGDGIFETIRVKDNNILFLPDHFERLYTGMLALSLYPPSNLTPQYISQTIYKLIEINNIGKNARVKIQVWRRNDKSQTGYTPGNNDVDFFISATKAQPLENTVKKNVLFFYYYKLHYSPLSRFKTCNSLPYVLAGIEKNNHKADDMIFFDIEDNISECIDSNIFWIKDNILFTPAIKSGCIEGVMRKNIMITAAQLNIKVEEVLAKKEELLNADHVFTSNVSAIQPVVSIENKKFGVDSEILELIVNNILK